ncbi:MAG: hypothetical protein F6K09_10045 [Merismopedia sp. SIO2A8]|nr:hypothetical protein [Merismopedia sp. SIO2A8]
MDAFALEPPEWTQTALHACEFRCPACKKGVNAAQAVWLNRRSPVYTPDQKRKWQEFYHCSCGQVWWAWSSDRPPSKLTPRATED